MASTVHDFEKTKKFNKPTKFRYVRMIVMENLIQLAFNPNGISGVQ